MSRIQSNDNMNPNYRETTERFWVLRLIREVQPDGVHIRLTPIHRTFRHIPAGEIDDVTVTTYSPVTYGGWHWGARRTLSGNTAYRLRGDQGVEIVLDGGTKIFIGSQSPSEFATAIQQAAETV